MFDTSSTRPSIIDTHVHLDDEAFDRDRDEVLASARAVGVRHFINVGYRRASWDTTIDLASREADISYSLGIHPQHAEEFSESVLADLERHIGAEKLVAIGEIGLDFFRGGPEPALQRRAFAAQLELAARHGLPAIIHHRAAETDLIDVLSESARPPAVILHSFEGSAEFVRFAIDQDHFVGIGGLATKPSAAGLRSLLKVIPTDRLLVETDSPYLAPPRSGDRRNTSANLPLILDRLAPIWGISADVLAELTWANAQRAFPRVHIDVTVVSDNAHRDVPTLLLATGNQGKRREFVHLLPPDVRVVTLSDVGVEALPEEGESFQAIARAKALHAARSTGLLCLADDSGLEVDTLGGAPGIFSARFAGPETNDQNNITKLLGVLDQVDADRPRARFRCAVALARPDGIVAEAEGTVEGSIVRTPAGDNGFGYDPIFALPDGRTMAQLAPEEKSKISHRAKAYAAVLPQIRRQLGLSTQKDEPI